MKTIRITILYKDEYYINVLYTFALRKADQRDLLMNCKHYQSDAFQVSNQLLVVTTN